MLPGLGTSFVRAGRLAKEQPAGSLFLALGSAQTTVIDGLCTLLDPIKTQVIMGSALVNIWFSAIHRAESDTVSCSDWSPKVGVAVESDPASFSDALVVRNASGWARSAIGGSAGP